MRGDERDKLGLVIAGLLGAAWGFASLGKYTAVMEGYGEHSVLGKILVLPAYLFINVLLGGLTWFLETIISAVLVLFAFVLPIVLGGLIAILLYKTLSIIKNSPFLFQKKSAIIPKEKGIVYKTRKNKISSNG